MPDDERSGRPWCAWRRLITEPAAFASGAAHFRSYFGPAAPPREKIDRRRCDGPGVPPSGVAADVKQVLVAVHHRGEHRGDLLELGVADVKADVDVGVPAGVEWQRGRAPDPQAAAGSTRATPPRPPNCWSWSSTETLAASADGGTAPSASSSGCIQT